MSFIKLLHIDYTDFLPIGTVSVYGVSVALNADMATKFILAILAAVASIYTILEKRESIKERRLNIERLEKEKAEELENEQTKND